MTNALQIALDLIGRDISPVPVPKGEKNPNRKKWQLLRITAADVPKFFGKDSPNVGALMGLASGGLTDIDLDCKEAVQLAPYFLPRTGSIYGRPSQETFSLPLHVLRPGPESLDQVAGRTRWMHRRASNRRRRQGLPSVMPGSHPHIRRTLPVGRGRQEEGGKVCRPEGSSNEDRSRDRADSTLAG